jgi:hypothetical protein
MLVDVIPKFKEIMDLKREADRKLLVLMAHPDVTAEQLVRANKSCLAMDTKLTEGVTKLRGKYPAHKSIVSLPWNKPEFDKYERKE